MRPEDAADYVGGARNLAVLEAFFGLKKTVSHHRNTTYSKDRLDQAFRRADAEGWPSPEQIAAKLTPCPRPDPPKEAPRNASRKSPG